MIHDPPATVLFHTVLMKRKAICCSTAAKQAPKISPASLESSWCWELLMVSHTMQMTCAHATPIEGVSLHQNGLIKHKSTLLSQSDTHVYNTWVSTEHTWGIHVAPHPPDRDLSES